MAVATLLLVLHDRLSHAPQALLLVVPVVCTAVFGGRHPGYVTAALATLMFLLVLPPSGSLRLSFTEDLVALVVFMLVAFAIASLVAVRVDVLGQIERQRAVLLRSVSHDLRTPLAAITAGVSELRDERWHGPQSRQRLLAVVAGQAEHLDRLVGDLFSLTRLEGGVTPERRPVDIAALVRDCARRAEPRHVGAVITVDAEDGLPSVQGDRTLLEQLVTNLLDNALRHSPAGAPVNITARREASVLRLSVSDAGPGVAPEDAKALFEPFRSGTNAGGGGLGLAICQAVAEAHGGTIDVRESPRGGAAFTVTLPFG